MLLKVYTLNKPLYVQAYLDKTLGKDKIVASYIYMNGDIEFMSNNVKSCNDFIKTVENITGRYFSIIDEGVEILCFELEDKHE